MQVSGEWCECEGIRGWLLAAKGIHEKETTGGREENVDGHGKCFELYHARVVGHSHMHVLRVGVYTSPHRIHVWNHFMCKCMHGCT